MEDALNRYLRSLSDPEIPVGLSDVDCLMKDYPFFTLPALTLMQREGGALPTEIRTRMLEMLALNAPDPVALATLVDSNREIWQDFYPSERKAPVTTDNVIDKFLATYGHSSPEDDALLERLIFNPTADYAAVLEKEVAENLPDEPEAGDDSQDALISSFILKNTRHESQFSIGQCEPLSDGQSAGDAATDVAGVSDEKTQSAPIDHPISVSGHSDDTSLSESLAKIYIRRRRYDKAFEIIHTLSLNNPKKSVYFADQLRFLRKLMLNSNYNEQNKPS